MITRVLVRLDLVDGHLNKSTFLVTKGAFKNYVENFLDFFNPSLPPGGQFYLIGLVK